MLTVVVKIKFDSQPHILSLLMYTVFRYWVSWNTELVELLLSFCVYMYAIARTADPDRLRTCFRSCFYHILGLGTELNQYCYCYCLFIPNIYWYYHFKKLENLNFFFPLPLIFHFIMVGIEGLDKKTRKNYIISIFHCSY